MTTKFISDMGPKSALIAPRPLDILRKIAESIKHGLAKSKRVSQKTQRAIPAKNSREG